MMIETERLLLRPWQDCDIAPFAEMNRDRKVMRYFPELMTDAQTAASVERARSNARKFGYWFLPVVEKQTGEFVGMCGIAQVLFDAHFTPAIEIGWRLAHAHWGKGYATEAAMAWLNYGFRDLGLAEIVSFTVANNMRSISVMRRIGMMPHPEADFMHPSIDPTSALAGHVLYQITAKEFAATLPS